MKTLALLLLLSGITGFAQERMTMIKMLSTDASTTRIITIKSNDVWTLKSIPVGNTGSIYWRDKGKPVDQVPLYSWQGSNPLPLTIIGPAELEFRRGEGWGFITTWAITPTVTTVDKTVIIPKGDPGGLVQLESSSDLVNWAAATNGLYTFPTDHKFFRIKLEKIP